jgi:hypothetical protein
MTGTHSGHAFAFPASGNPFAINGNDIICIVHGKITQIYHVEESLKSTQQFSTGAVSRAQTVGVGADRHTGPVPRAAGEDLLPVVISLLFCGKVIDKIVWASCRQTCCFAEVSSSGPVPMRCRFGTPVHRATPHLRRNADASQVLWK